MNEQSSEEILASYVEKRRSDQATCSHQLLPLEWIAGKRTWQDGNWYIDWTSNIINAHQLRVTKYWCPLCNSIIQPPSDTPDL